MKTKRLLPVALAQASLLAAPVRVPAIVGYVNQSYTNGLYYLVANPFHTLNDLPAEVLPHPPVGTRVYVWDVTNQVFWPPAVYQGSAVWTTNLHLPPGNGFVLFAPSRFTNTYVGEVVTDSTNLVAGGNKFSLLSSAFPRRGEISSALFFPGIDGADAYFFRNASQSFTDAYTYFTGHGWFDPKGVAGTGGPFLEIANAFFVQNPGPDTNWVQHFPISRPERTSPASKSTAAEIRRIRVAGGNFALAIHDPGGGRYNVQFSTDGLTWTTVATNRTGHVWTGVLPNARWGYFKLTNP